MEVHGHKSEEAAVSDSDLKNLYCDPCNRQGDTSLAAGYCKHCGEYLCTPCVKSHRGLKLTKDHEILTRDNMPITRGAYSDCSVPETEFCSVHVKTKEPIKFYCTAHDAFGCGDCIVLSHRTCKVEYIADVAKGFKNSNEFKAFETSLDDITKAVDELCNTVDDVKENNIKQRQSAIDDIREFQREINAYVEKKVADLSAQIETSPSDEQTISSEVKTQCENSKDKMNHVKADISNKSSHDDQLFMYYKRNQTVIEKVRQDIENNKQKCVALRKCFRFERNKALQDLLCSDTPLGTFKSGQDQTSVNTPMVLDLVSTKIVAEEDINIRTKEDQLNCSSSSIVLWAPDEFVLADWYNNAVKVVNTSTRKVTSRLQLSSWPHDLTTLDNNMEMAVSLPSVKQIKILSLTNNSLQEVRTINVSGECWGISHSHRQLAVLYNGKVEIMDTNGVVTRVIQNGRIVGFLGYLCFSVSGKELFVKCKNDAVCKFSLKGECLATYSDPDLRDIRAMTVTRDGKLLVCGCRSQNIHVVSQECRKLGVMLSEEDGWRYLVSLCLCEDTGKLYVGSWGSDKMQVYGVQ